MKIWAIYLIFGVLIIANLESKGQTDTLNKFNKNGKKIGYWKAFLNDKVDPVNKEKDSYFYTYELWDNGERVWKDYKHKYKYEKITYDKSFPEKGKPVAIDGTFNWYDKDGNLLSTEIYKNGHPKFMKSYVRPVFSKGPYTFNEVLYIDSLYNNIRGTYYYEEYNKGILTFQGWFRKGEKGWRVYMKTND